ncbi:MAG TPA: TldD/PmbA family protein, partial [Ignisphaera sp.]|nr:TldD/PmbA family protein [Ignisphaera sp.]
MSVEDMVHKALDYALKQGVKLCIARFHERVYERIEVDRGALKEYSYTRVRGLGVAVYIQGGYGYAYTSRLDMDSIHKTVEKAIVSARAIATHTTELRKLMPVYGKHSFKVEYRINPFDVPAEEKIALILKLNRESMDRQGIVSATTRMGIEHERKLIVTSEGGEISIEVMMVGISHLSIARDGATAERVYDHKSNVGGYEFIERTDWHAFISEVDTLAIEASRASTPAPGVYTAIIDNRLIGLLLHEAFGHASEGDTVLTGSSVLRDKLGQTVASELVTIIDEGLVNGGYPVPFDDEGNPKRRTVVVERGVLKNFLTSSIVAEKLNLQLTGNARAQSFNYEPLVRQTNYYLEP